MKSLIIALTAALSAPAVAPAIAAELGHVMLVGMAAPATEAPATTDSVSAATTAISRATYSTPSLSKGNLIPASARKLDFHSAHASRRLGGQRFDWAPAATSR